MTNNQQYGAILENHYYGMNGPAIKYDTRNVCSDATAKMLEEIAKILFPNEEIEIYVLPAQDGCHQDTFWIKNKDQLITGAIITVIGAIFIVPGQISQIITDNSTRKLNDSQIEVNHTQKELNQIQIEQSKHLKEVVIKSNPQSTITDEQYRKIVASDTIRKNKNQHFRQLEKDNDIKKEKIVAKQDGKIIFEKTIESIQFGDYIEDIQTTITTKTIEKIHQLTVIKSVNTDEYKELMWVFEDPVRKEKFSIHMSDEDFYAMHLKKPIGLKTLIVRAKYTIDEDERRNIFIKNKEIILVYKYNDIERYSLPEGEDIYPAPLEFGYINEDEYKIIQKVQKQKNIKDYSPQLSVFDLT